jgi:hypothetical protein
MTRIQRNCVDITKAAGVISRRFASSDEPVLSSARLTATLSAASLLTATLSAAALLAAALLTATLLTAFFGPAPLSIAILFSALLSSAGRSVRLLWILLCVHDAFLCY